MHDGFLTVAVGTPEIRVADCAFNTQSCLHLIRQAAAQGVKVLALPELCLCGYSCGDLFLQEPLLRAAEEGLNVILTASQSLDMLIAVGLPVRHRHKLFNCCALLCRGRLLGLVPKGNLPNYSEFYEGRWFVSGEVLGDEVAALSLAGQEAVPMSMHLLFPCETYPLLTVGAEVCEDLWVADTPSTHLALAGANVIVNLSASNETVGKDDYRRTLLRATSGRLLCAYLYANAGWGESSTDLIYAGHSLILEDGVILTEQRFETGLSVTQIDLQRLANQRQRISTFSPRMHTGRACPFSLTVEQTALTRPVTPNPFVPNDGTQRNARCQEILTLAALGLKKRLAHTGAKAAVLGLSGGLDSTLALLITVRAMEMLGRPTDDILAVTLPCFGTTSRTRSNAARLAELLGVSFRTINISAAVTQHFLDIKQEMDDLSVTFENAQARERTQVLMDLANQRGGLVVGTGDLSELALGWATYNGDHMSMYAVNAGIPKTLVRHLVAYAADQVAADQAPLAAVLRDIVSTPVSPELLPPTKGEISQRTEDLVGPYELHDFFLYYTLRFGFSPKKVFRLAVYALGEQYEKAVILKWLEQFYRRFFAQQFKRSCLPDGPKIGSITLSPRGDWRMPSDASAALWLEELKNLQ